MSHGLRIGDRVLVRSRCYTHHAPHAIEYEVMALDPRGFPLLQPVGGWPKPPDSHLRALITDTLVRHSRTNPDGTVDRALSLWDEESPPTCVGVIWVKESAGPHYSTCGIGDWAVAGVDYVKVEREAVAA